MNIAVLGPLHVDSPQHLGPRERVVLSVLILHRGQTVRTHTLADALWADSPPPSWRKQLQASIGLIRRALGPARVATTPNGYSLQVEPDEIDVERLQGAVARGRIHAAGGDPERAVAELRAALAIPNGAPWQDLEGWPGAIDEIQRITEVLRSVEDDVLLARLAAGDHRGVAEDAVPLASSEPLREVRWRALALAQYRCGRQGDALATLRRARRILADELGAEPGGDLTDLEGAILRHDPVLLMVPEPAKVDADCPYPGLKAYGADDQDRFFGRDPDISRAVQCLALTRFLLVAGPSGSGKSSLLRAGVVPVFARRGVAATFTTPSTGVTALHDSRPDDGRHLIVIDQFEEVFTRPSSVVKEYCAAIAVLANQGNLVAVVVRSDLLDACARHEVFASRLPDSLQLLTSPAGAALRETIERPALSAGLHFEPGLVEMLLGDADGRPGILPLLSHALAETWRRREGSALTLAGYEAAGGISGAVTQSAERLFRSLSKADRALCRSLLLRLVSLTPAMVTVPHPMSLRNLGSDARYERLVGVLARARLVSVEADTVALTHESLAREWPRLRVWLEEDADGKRTLDHLAAAAGAWDESGHSEDELYRGARLGTVIEWQRSASPELTSSEELFLEASLRSREEDDVRRAEVARREAQQNVTLRRLLAACAGLLALALLAGTVAVISAFDSERAEREAQLAALVHSSESLRSSARDTAALLAVEAYRRWPDDPRARSALLGTFTASPGFLGYSHVDGSRGLRGNVLADDQHAVVRLSDGGFALLDFGGTVLRRFHPPAGDQRTDPYVAASVDGGRAISAYPTALTGRCGDLATSCSEIRVLNLDKGRWERAPMMVAMAAGDLAIDSTGRTAAMVEWSTGRVVVLGLSGDQEGGVTLDGVQAPSSPRGSAGSITFLSDGTLAVGSAVNVRLVDPASGAVIGEVPVPPFTANQALVDAGGGTLIGSGDRGLVAISIESGSTLWSVGFESRHPVPCPRLAASVLSGTAYCGDYFGGIEERRLDDGGLTGAHFDPQFGDVGEIAVSSSGDTLISIGADESVLSRWRLDGSGLIAELVAPEQVLFDSYDPSGKTFVTALRPVDATIDVDFTDFSVWDAGTASAVHHIDEPGEGFGWAGRDLLVGLFTAESEIGFYDLPAEQRVAGVDIPLDAFHLWAAASGTRLYAGFADGTIWTIDPITRQRISPTLQVDGVPTSVSANADGSVVLVSSRRATGPAMVLINGHTGEELVPSVPGAEVSVLGLGGEIFGATGGHISRYDSQLRQAASIGSAGGGIASLQLSEDGAVLLAASNDQTVSVFDTATSAQLGTPIISTAPFITPGFLRPDGLAAAVTGRRGVVEWNLDAAALAVAACTFAGRNLTEAEWSSHLTAFGEWRATCPSRR